LPELTLRAAVTTPMRFLLEFAQDSMLSGTPRRTSQPANSHSPPRRITSNRVVKLLYAGIAFHSV
jgi:hypothetical protein